MHEGHESSGHLPRCGEVDLRGCCPFVDGSELFDLGISEVDAGQMSWPAWLVPESIRGVGRGQAPQKNDVSCSL